MKYLKKSDSFFFNLYWVALIAILVALMIPFRSLGKGIKIKDFATEFSEEYLKMLDPTPDDVAHLAIRYESKYSALFNAAYYATMSKVSKDSIFQKSSSQYSQAATLVPKYHKKISDIKKIATELQDRYKKELGADLDFDIYLWSSLVDTDGSTFTFNGKPAFAINLRLAANYSLEQLKILLSHEAFHIYQDKNTNSNKSKLSLIQSKLWSEGWATYVSSVVYPGMSDWHYVSYYQENDSEYQDYFRKLNSILRYVDENINSDDTEIFGKLFSANEEMTDPLPPRSGYFIGYQMAKELAKTKTAKQVADMKHEDYQKVERVLIDSLRNKCHKI